MEEKNIEDLSQFPCSGISGSRLGWLFGRLVGHLDAFKGGDWTANDCHAEMADFMFVIFSEIADSAVPFALYVSNFMLGWEVDRTPWNNGIWWKDLTVKDYQDKLKVMLGIWDVHEEVRSCWIKVLADIGHNVYDPNDPFRRENIIRAAIEETKRIAREARDRQKEQGEEEHGEPGKTPDSMLDV
jgi:hypothetical protein